MNESPEFLFAKKVIQRLTDSGFQALLAGGCVRDFLLGRTPKDYDVATDATPSQVQEIFGERKTIAIGAAFGVITVIGTKTTGHIEVATFRQDGNYSDGRRPESVTFCNAKEDAIRRDFTINGLFFDTQTDQVVDYVEGQIDLEKKSIRAIGTPADRFGEDRLRMLRAVRFATTLGFHLESETLKSIQNLAPNISEISSERIATEMEKLLSSDHRSFGLQLLSQSKLAAHVFSQWWGNGIGEEELQKESAILQKLSTEKNPDFPTILATLLWQRFQRENPVSVARLNSLITKASKVPKKLELGNNPFLEINEEIQKIFAPIFQSIALQTKQWKLSNEYQKVMNESIKSLSILCTANHTPWSVLQPVLVSKYINQSLKLAESVLYSLDRDEGQIDFCRSKRTLPETELNPAVLIDGGQLQKMGIPRGPEIGLVMKTLRQKQLDEPGFDIEQATRWVKGFLESQNC